MSTGISISSVNRIKELAEQKEYAEALKILDTQDLDKSINPQFLRISGEIFRENKRYYDSRKILLKAHQMSPMGTRIIFELIQLYLELGYYTKAKKYYEQYQFYSTDEDVQKDYVEYLMKKATGTDAKELASILIPILERMPEDRWNFEAVLLYDKLDRKDKALEESQYILENFKESIYVKPTIKYIDDKLDVDAYFYVFPKEEQEENRELFGSLIEEEEKLLQTDYLRMYPPEPKILVEVEDKEAVETKPAKEKESKKRLKKKTKKKDKTEKQLEEVSNEPAEEQHTEKVSGEEVKSKEEQEAEEQERLKQEREAALEKLLSRKIDKDKIKESAKQVAKAVKDIDTTKAKTQVMSVAESVKDNVKKATDAFSGAVGARQSQENDTGVNVEAVNLAAEEQIIDGIIESVLEPPKKAVGQVVMNEELDALIPDSLEAMSAEEIAEIEAKKEEAERLELEALEAALKLEEEKKSRNRILGKVSSGREESLQNIENENSEEQDTEKSPAVEAENFRESETKHNFAEKTYSFEEKKAEFLAKLDDEQKPLDSLGFITVVQSDVDSLMKEQIPEAADILHQMIDNKEYYSGEDSSQFESRISYDKHEFEVEDFDFETYRTAGKNEKFVGEEDKAESELYVDEKPAVEIIYAEEKTIVDFDEIVPVDDSPVEYALEEVKSEEETEKPVDYEEFKSEEPEEEPAAYEEFKLEEPEEEPVVYEEFKSEELEEEPTAYEEFKSEEPEGEPVAYEEFKLEEPEEEPAAYEEFKSEELEEEPTAYKEIEPEEESVQQDVEEGVLQEEVPETSIFRESILENVQIHMPEEKWNVEENDENRVIEKYEEEYINLWVDSNSDNEEDDQNIIHREELRLRIVLSEHMVQKLLDLKESR